LTPLIAASRTATSVTFWVGGTFAFFR